MKNIKKCSIIIIVLMLFASVLNFGNFSFYEVKGAETWSLAWSSGQGKAGTSKDSLSANFALTNQTVGKGYTIYYSAPNYAKLDSIKLYKKNSDGSLTLKTNYDVTNATYQDHIWFSPSEAGAYVLQGVWSEPINMITTKTKNLIGNIDGFVSGEKPEKGGYTVREKTVDEGSTHTVYFQSVPSGFAVGSGVVGHEQDLTVTITYADGTVVKDYATKVSTAYETYYTYTLTNVTGHVILEARAEIQPTPNTTEITIKDKNGNIINTLDDSDIDTSLNYHINRMPIDGSMTYRVEKWIPPLASGYRFDNLYRWELELSPAMEVTGYRFTFDKTNQNSTTWKTDNTDTLSTSNDYITYKMYENTKMLYSVMSASYIASQKAPVYFYNWDENVIFPNDWNAQGRTSFANVERSNCINNIHVFDFIEKDSDDLYGTYLILEVDLKKKDNIDLSDSQYQYLVDKTHNFNGGYYFSYKSGSYQFTNREKAITQDGAHGLLKLQFDPAKVGSQSWIQSSHRWDYARDVFTIFQYKLTTVVKNGTISTLNDEGVLIDGSTIKDEGATNGNSKIVSVDAAKTASVSYKPRDGYALKSVTVDGVALTKVNLKTYKDGYKMPVFNEDHEIIVVFAPAYKITTEVINGTIDPDITDIPEGNTEEIAYKANNGYALSYIEVDGKRLSETDLKDFVDVYEFTNIQQDHHIKVVYERKETSLIIKKRINQSETYSESGFPTFIFEIKGTDYEGKSHTYYRTISFEDTGSSSFLIKEVKVENIPAGTYTIREIDTARYTCSVYSMTHTTKINNTTVTANTDITDGGYEDCSVTFYNQRSDYHNFDDNALSINKFNKK